MNKLSTLKETECSCEYCQAMCHRPCWGTPEDIQKIIDAGFGDRLMKDAWFCKGDEDIPIIAPALKGKEGQQCPFNPMSKKGCTFFIEGKCELHDLGLKPKEGKVSHHDDDPDEINVHEEVARLWSSEKGTELAKKWCKTHNVDLDGHHDLLEILLGSLELGLLHGKKEI